MHYTEIKHLSYHVLDRLDPRITELHHFMAIGTDQVIMLFVAIGFFELCQVFAKLVLGNEVAIHQNVERVVNRRAADTVTLIFHADVKLIYIEVIFPGVDLLQNRKPLRRFTKSLIFQVSRQYFLSGFEIWFAGLWHISDILARKYAFLLKSHLLCLPYSSYPINYQFNNTPES